MTRNYEHSMTSFIGDLVLLCIDCLNYHYNIDNNNGVNDLLDNRCMQCSSTSSHGGGMSPIILQRLHVRESCFVA